MRINKYIAQAGIASRRKADELIANGNVKVNGAVMKEPGYDVTDEDKVEVNGSLIGTSREKVYLLVNKPLNMITSASDDRDRETVMEIVKDVDSRLFPVGRLDYNTTGALIMTNDGDLSYRITHPKHEMDKTYRALVKGVVSKEKLARLRSGVDIGGFVTSRARARIIKGMDTLLQGGVTPVELVGGVCSVIRGVTTRTKTGEAADATWRELTTILVVDDVIPSIRAALGAKFARAKNTAQTRGAVRSQVILELEGKVAAEIISGYGEVTAQALESDPTVCLVTFSFTVAQGLNQIWLSAQITV